MTKNVTDIFDYVLEQMSKETKDDAILASDYIAYAKELFAKKAPVGTTFAEGGLGLVMPDHTVICIGAKTEDRKPNFSMPFTVANLNSNLPVYQPMSF